jgi:hypothetical protein
MPATGVSLIPCDGDPSHYLPRNPLVQLRRYNADIWLPPLQTPHVVTLEAFDSVYPFLETFQFTPGGEMAYTTQPLNPPATTCADAKANVIPPNTASAIWVPADLVPDFARFSMANEWDGSDDFYANGVGIASTWFGPTCPEPELSGLCNRSASGTDCIVGFGHDSSGLPTWYRIINGPPVDGTGTN